MNKTLKNKPSGPVVLITGGSGFLGSALVRELCNKNRKGPLAPREIRIFDLKPSGSVNDKQIQYIKGDIRSLEVLKRAFEGVDIVFHCAAIVDWGQNPRRLVHEINVRGSHNVITASKQSKVKALVYTSTMDVLYEGRPIINGDETMPYPKKFSMAYAETKAIAEQMTLAANDPLNADNRQEGNSFLRTCAIRPCGMFGEGDPYHVSSCLKMAQKSNLAFRIGSGKALFQHVYVGNVAHAHLLAAESLLQPRSRAAGKSYFITDFDAKNFFDYMEPIINGIGYSMPSKHRSIPLSLIYPLAGLIELVSKICRPFFRFNPPINRTSASMVCKDLTFSGDRARRELGYRPLYTEKEAIARTVEYFRKYGPV